MSKYIDVEKLINFINQYQEDAKAALNPYDGEADCCFGKMDACNDIQGFITSHQQEQTEIEKEAEISPGIISNFGPCTFNLSVTFTQDEMEKMNIAPFLTKKVNIIIKEAE